LTPCAWRCFFLAACAFWLGIASLGCAGDAEPTTGPVTIVYSHGKHPRAAYLPTLIAQFEAEHPNVRVREAVLPSSTDEQHQFYVINLAGASRDFDVMDLDIIWVPEFARAGWLADLTPEIPAAALAPLNRAALRADWLQERLYAVPWFVDAGVLYYRKDLLEKYKLPVPRTYPELAQAANEILAGEQDPRLTGFLWQGMQYEGLVCAALEFIHGAGGTVLGDDGRPALTNERTLGALRFMSDLIRVRGVTPPLVTTLDEENARRIFESGRAIFMRNWPYAWPLMQRPGSAVAGRIGVTIVPHFAGYESAPTLGGFHLAINARSRHPSEASAFVRFMITREVQRQVLLQMGVLAADMHLLAEADIQEQVPHLSDLLPALEHARPRPVTPYYLMISQILQPELSAAVSGLRSPEEAMRSAQQQVEHLLGQE
jgi:multiple sugar transport system substrate-binding protein